MLLLMTQLVDRGEEFDVGMCCIVGSGGTTIKTREWMKILVVCSFVIGVRRAAEKKKIGENFLFRIKCHPIRPSK